LLPIMATSSSCCTPMVAEALTPEGAADLARSFKALGDPVRLRVLSLIAARAGGEVCVCEITDAFDLTGPTISHHLRVLRESGLVDSQRRGTWVYYWIIPAKLAALSQLLDPTSVAAPAGASPGPGRGAETA
jgi:ArsR family transcriptional regulator, arsenate/arsenite/antimonite-responsive transcriptional repressor